MDVGRFAYTSTMRLHRDEPERETAVRWYRVPWDRPALGVPTFATSSTFDPGPQLVQLGELASSRRWWAGEPAPFTPDGPPDPVGTPREWLDGLPPTPP